MSTDNRSTQTGAVVLLVDDEPAIRRLVRMILEESGYVVLDAANGLEGLAVCRAHPGHIDVLLSDLVMPELGGHELAARALELRPALKVLFMSGYTPEGAVDQPFRNDDAFLQKPFSSIALRQKIRGTLDSDSLSAMA